MTPQLTKAMVRELRSIANGGPTDPYDWQHAGPLWFHARDRVLGALLRRGLIVDGAEYRLTEAGEKAIA